MTDAVSIPDFNSQIVEHARKDFPLLDAEMSVAAALERIRKEGVGERVIYFFVTDSEKRLVGVLPTRRLLTAPLETRLEEIMVRRVVAIPASATVLEACEFFVLYKFFAFPIVDRARRVIGVVDVSLFAEEILEAGEREEKRPVVANLGDDVFEALGFRLAQIRGASPWRVFRYRFPWLLATVAAGTACAVLAGAFEATLAGSLVVAFFLTMVLGLNESVSMQSMTLTIQALRVNTLTSGNRDIAPAGNSVRPSRQRDRLDMAARRQRRNGRRRQHRCFTGDGVSVRVQRAVAFALAET